MKRVMIAAVVCLLAGTSFCGVIWDTDGFEAFTQGDINGQSGFSSLTADAYTVVDDPTGAGRGNVMQINSSGRVDASTDLNSFAHSIPEDPMYMHYSFSAYIPLVTDFDVVVKGVSGQLTTLTPGSSSGTAAMQARLGPTAGDANAVRNLTSISGYDPTGDSSWHDFDMVIKFHDDDASAYTEFSFYVDGQRMDTVVPSTFYTVNKVQTSQTDGFGFSLLASSAVNVYVDDVKIDYNNNPLPVPEPATVGLVGLGALIAGLVRRSTR